MQRNRDVYVNRASIRQRGVSDPEWTSLDCQSSWKTQSARPQSSLRRLLTWTLFALVCGFLSSATSSAWADLFRLRDGRRLEGTVIHETETFISIRTPEGIVTVGRDEIEEHEKTENVYDQYLERKKKVGPHDIEAQLALGEWCILEELYKESLYHFRRVIQVDPNNEKARAKLGFVRIKGYWYIEGTPEAEAARSKDKDVLTAPPVEMPENYVAPKAPQQPKSGKGKDGSKSGKGKTKHYVPGGRGPRVDLELSESVYGKPPKFSVASYEVGDFFRKLDEPLSLSSPGSTGGKMVLRMDIRVSFVRTHRFYGRIPISHIFTCAIKFELTDKDGKRLANYPRLTIPFSGGARRPKEEVAQAAYHYSAQTLIHYLSTHPYFKRRGAKFVAKPDW